MNFPLSSSLFPPSLRVSPVPGSLLGARCYPGSLEASDALESDYTAAGRGTPLLLPEPRPSLLRARSDVRDEMRYK